MIFKILIKFLILFTLTSPSWSVEFNCKSDSYYSCNTRQCNPRESTINIVVDFEERMVVRKTVKNGNDFMKIKNIWSRDNGSSLYVLYEDENSHGFIVINGSYHLYNDTLFTNFGSWVSGGACKKK